MPEEPNTHNRLSHPCGTRTYGAPVGGQPRYHRIQRAANGASPIAKDEAFV